MPSIRILPGAECDLDRLYEIDEDTAAEIEVALQEIEENPRLIDQLCRSGSYNLSRPHYDTKKVAIYQAQRQNVFRLKFWDWEGDLVPYRVLYTHHPQKDIYYVLAVGHRDFVYEQEHELTKRVVSDLDELGIPFY